MSTGGAEVDPDTLVLLLRQLYRSQLEAHRFREAADIAARMAEVGPLRDIALHDRARALAAMGDLDGAILAQRAAARSAPVERRSFQVWNLATLQHWAGDIDGALRTLTRAERWAVRDRAMMRAHAAYVRLSAGRAVRGLDGIVAALRKSPAREGYGQWLLGMIAHHLGDQRTAAAHLRAWLRRHAAHDEAKTISLREELDRARAVLVALESD